MEYYRDMLKAKVEGAEKEFMELNPPYDERIGKFSIYSSPIEKLRKKSDDSKEAKEAYFNIA